MQYRSALKIYQATGQHVEKKRCRNSKKVLYIQQKRLYLPSLHASHQLTVRCSGALNMRSNFSAKKPVQKAADVYAIIEGIPIALPGDAKYICQDKRGCWFFCARRPRIKDGDWTPNKTPIQLMNERGQLSARVLITDTKSNWSTTLQTTIKRAQLPMQH